MSTPGPRRRMKLASAVLAAVVLAGTAGSMATPGTSHAFSPLVYVAVKAGARLIGNNMHRRAEYTEITRNRDEDLAAVQTTQQVRDYQEERGWLDPAPYQQEQQRLEALSQGITDRAEREKQITRHDYNQALGDIPRQAAADAITALPGGSKIVRDFAANLVRGQDPLSAAGNALTDPSRPVTERLDTALQQIDEAKAAMDELGTFVRDRSALREDAVDRLRGEVLSLVDPTTQPPPTELEERIDKVAREIRDIVPSIRSLGQDLLGRPLRIDEARFARDQKWLDLNGHVQELETSDATKAVLAGMARAAQERVAAALGEYGVELSDANLARLIGEVAGDYARARAEARERGEDPRSVDINDVMKNTINRKLDEQGLLPVPAEDGTPETKPSPGPSPEGTPPPSATAAPTATATPLPPTPTPEPPTPTLVPPTATPVPPTQTPTPEPELPTVTVGGASFVDSASWVVTVTLVIDFKTGAVSGSVHGERSSSFTVNCNAPDGTLLDVATAALGETWSSGLGGGVGSDGGFSASFAGTSGGAFSLTTPFTVEGCVGREPPFPPYTGSAVAGTLAGTATTGGAVSFSSSTGGAWSGAGSVSY